MKVKALKTIAGYYGQINAGEEKVIAADVANDLKEAGLVEIIDEEAKEEPVKEGKDMTALRNTKAPKKS